MQKENSNIEKHAYEAPTVVDLSAILPIYGGYCLYSSGAYSADPECDE